MRAVMESEWPELAQKLPAGRCMRHWGLSARRGGKPGDGAASALPLGGCNMTILAPDPPNCLRRLGFVTTQRVSVARHDQENFCAPTHRGDTSPAGRGLPQRTPLPRPPVRDDRTDPSKKIRAFDGEVAIAVAQLYLVHVFQRSIPAGFFASRFPATTTKTPVQRSTVARSTRVDLRWQQRCVSVSICYDHGSSTGYRRCLKDHL